MKTSETKTSSVPSSDRTSFFSKESDGTFFDSTAHAARFFSTSIGGTPPVQPKLEVGQPNDKYEQQADKMADLVVTKKDNNKKQEREKGDQALRRKPIFESEAEAPDKEIQRQESDTGVPATSPSLEDRLDKSKGNGMPLPDDINRSMSNDFGTDLSKVRIHNDPAAASMSKELNAQAFTHGSDIYFNSGKYDTTSPGGKHLLAHELTHTVQQDQKPKSVQKNGDGANSGQAAQSTIPGPPYIKDGFELNAAINPKSLKVPKLSLPTFKERNASKFKWPILFMAGRVGTKQETKWRDAVKPSVDARTPEFLKEQKIEKKSPGDVYFLKLRSTDLNVFGSINQLNKAFYLPDWDRFGKPRKHQVDHIVEMQTGGADGPENYELLDGEVNTAIGSNLQKEIYKRINQALKLFNDNNVPNVPTPSEIKRKESPTTIVSFEKLDGWNIAPSKGDGKFYWSIEEIKEGKHMLQLRSMTLEETLALNGSDKKLLLFVKPNEGKPHEIELPAKKKDNWLPGIDLLSVTVTNSKAAAGEVMGNISVAIQKNVADQFNAPSSIVINFTKIEGLLNAGGLEFTGVTEKMAMLFSFTGLSPVQVTSFDIDDSGLVVLGTISAEVPLIKDASIDFSIRGKDIRISKTFSVAEIKQFPKPFKVTDVSLTIFAGTESGFGLEGNIEFEIEKIGKGSIEGIAAKGGAKSFGLTGRFTPDKKIFDGFIKASYEKQPTDPAGKWTIEGAVTVGEKKIPGLDKLILNFLHKEDKLTINGDATLSLKNVSKIVITGNTDPEGNLTVTGTIALKDIPKLEGASATLTIDKDLNVELDGSAKPKLDIPGIKPKEVKISYKKGVFELAASAHYEKGRISGDVNVGVTNKPVSEDGVLGTGDGNKDLKFYADGSLQVDIAKGIGSLITIKIKPDGDIILDGEISLTKAKPLLDKLGYSKTFTLIDQNVPLASCIVVTLNLYIGGDATFYANLLPLQFDAGSSVTLSNVSLRKFNPVITSKIDLSSHLDAGVSVSLKIGLNASLLGVLLAGVTAKGDLDFVAISADAHAHFGAKWSAENGVQLTESTLSIELQSKLITSLSALISVWVNLLVTKVTLWERKWEIAKKEYPLDIFGSGKKSIKLPINESGEVDLDTAKLGTNIKDVGDSVSSETVAKRSKSLIDGTGENKVDQQANASAVTKEAVLKRFRDPTRFEFNKSVNYLKERYALYNHLKTNGVHNKSIDFSYIDEEIKKCEFEEYEAFGPWLATDKTFSADTKFGLIDDFMINHPTLSATHKVNLRSNVPKDPPKTTALQRKPEDKDEQPENATFALPPSPEKGTHSTISDNETDRPLPEKQTQDLAAEKETTGVVPQGETPGAVPEKDVPAVIPGRASSGVAPPKELTGAIPGKEAPGAVPQKEITGAIPGKETAGTISGEETDHAIPVKETQAAPSGIETQSATGEKNKSENQPQSQSKQDTGLSVDNKEKLPGPEQPSSKKEKPEGQPVIKKEPIPEDPITMVPEVHQPDLDGDISDEFTPLPPLSKLPQAEGSGTGQYDDTIRTECVNRIASEKEKVLNDIATHVASLGKNIIADAALIRSSAVAIINGSITDTRAKYAEARQHLKISVLQAEIETTTSFLTNTAAAIAEGEKTKDAIRGMFNNSGPALDTAVQEGIDQSQTMLVHYTDEAATRSDLQAEKARVMGEQKAAAYPDTERGYEQRQAVREVASQTIAEMQSRKPETVNAVASLIAPIPEQFRNMGIKAKSGITEHSADLIKVIDANVKDTLVQLNQSHTGTLQQLAAMETQMNEQLSLLEKESVAKLSQIIPQIDMQLAQATAVSTQALQLSETHLSEQLAGKADEGIAVLEQTEDADGAASKDLAQKVVAFLQGATTDAMAILSEGSSGMLDKISEIRANTFESATAFINAAATVLTDILQGYDSGMRIVVRTYQHTLVAIIGSMSAAFHELLSQIQGQLTQGVAALKSEMNKTLKDAGAEVTKAISEGMAKNDEALLDMNSKMDEAAEEAAWDYDHPVLSAIGSVLSFVAGLVLGILKILLIVVIVIVAFEVIIAAMVAVGISLIVAEITVLVVGLALLAEGVYDAYQARKAAGESGGLGTLGASLLDVTGITGIYRGFTQKGLTPFQRGFSIGEGVGTFASFFVARKISRAVRGRMPPPGSGRAPAPRTAAPEPLPDNVIPFRPRAPKTTSGGPTAINRGPRAFTGDQAFKIAPEVPEVAPEIPVAEPAPLPAAEPVLQPMAGKAPSSKSALGAAAATGIVPKGKKKKDEEEDKGVLYKWQIPYNYQGRDGRLNYRGKTRKRVDYDPNGHHVWPKTLGGPELQEKITLINTIHNEEIHYGRSPAASPVVLAHGSIYNYLEKQINSSPQFGPDGMNILQGRKLTHPGGKDQGNVLLIDKMGDGTAEGYELAIEVRNALTRYYGYFQTFSDPQVPYNAYRKGLDDSFNAIV